MSIRRCIKCFRHSARPAQQIMGDSPAARCTPSKPFTHYGIDNGGPFKVTDWVGKRDAWSAHKPNDPRTKPTRWEFHNGRQQRNENVGSILITGNGDRCTHFDEIRRIRSADTEKERVKINSRATNDGIHLIINTSRTNLINEQDISVDDAMQSQEEEQHFNKIRRVHQKHQNVEKGQKHQIETDSIRQHEIDRGSEVDFSTEHIGFNNKRELFMKDGNIEILQLMTSEKAHDGPTITSCVPEDDNTSENVPVKCSSLCHPHYFMVENSGKEILMRRFIEEQPDGKQVIREHYQIVPGAAYTQSMPNEIQKKSVADTNTHVKSGSNSIVYSQTEPEETVIHTQPAHGSTGTLHVKSSSNSIQMAISNQALKQDLESSIKRQNELICHLHMGKENIGARYDLACETQSLPGPYVATATQTACETGTQTEFNFDILQKASIGTQRRVLKRRARSENDDSESERSSQEYIHLSSSNSPIDVVYCIKRRKPRRLKQFRYGSQFRGRFVGVEEPKRKIRTPIKEEDENSYKIHKRLIPKKPPRKRSAIESDFLQSLKEEAINSNILLNNEHLNCGIVMEIFDSSHENYNSKENQKAKKNNGNQSEFDLSLAEEGDFIQKYENLNHSDGGEVIIKKRSSTTLQPLAAKTKSRQPGPYEVNINTLNENNYESKSQWRLNSRSDEQLTAIPSDLTLELFKRDTSTRKYFTHRHHISENKSNNDIKITSPEFFERGAIQNKGDIVEITSVRSHTERIPKYMQWYYNNKKHTSIEPSTIEIRSSKKKGSKPYEHEKKKMKTKIFVRPDNVDQKRIDKLNLDEAPRRSPPKGSRLFKEDVKKNKNLQARTLTKTSHPLLQHSQYGFQRESVLDVRGSHSKLSSSLYPGTTPFFEVSTNKDANETRLKPTPAPNKESETNTSKTISTLSVQRQLNAATLEDDHDSGIAMNSLLNSMGHRYPIAEKKSVFSIAYDDVSRVQKIASAGESPPN